MNCPICFSQRTETVMEYDEYPYFTVPLTVQDKEEILGKYDEEELHSLLRVELCVDCNHAYLDPVPGNSMLDELYSNYYTYPSPLKDKFEPIRDNQFLDYFHRRILHFCRDKGLKTVFEIGCFDGYILHNLKKYGFTVKGCDPSNGADIGNSFDIDIRKEFFNAKKFLEMKLTFDVVISRHFIEHVTDPISYVRSFVDITNEGGIIILETPNVDYYLNKGLPEVFSLQHIMLFSKSSMRRMLNQLNFEVITIEETPNNLIVVVKK